MRQATHSGHKAGLAWHGWAVFGWARQAWHGWTERGLARQARYGRSRLDTAMLSLAWQAKLGPAWQSRTRCGTAGKDKRG